MSILVEPFTILQKPSDDQERVILELDATEIPRQIKMQQSKVLALDNVVRIIHHVPKKHRNYWMDLGYDDILKVMWDVGGHPYIDVAAKQNPKYVIRVMIKEEDAVDILDLLLTATDFCDYCGGPLNPNRQENQLLEYGEGGGTVADIIECQFCEEPNIRWDKDFLEDHPILEKAGLKTK